MKNYVILGFILAVLAAPTQVQAQSAQPQESDQPESQAHVVGDRV